MNIEDLNIPEIYSNGIKVTYSSSSIVRKIITITNLSKEDGVRYLERGATYSGSLKYEYGSGVYGYTASYEGGTCSIYTSGTTSYIPVEVSEDEKPNTYVIYNGMNDGSGGLNVINLQPATKYRLIIYTGNEYQCYDLEQELDFTTGFITNTISIRFNIFDNKTRLPLYGSSISVKNQRGFISDFATLPDAEYYITLPLEEGMYSVSIICTGYEQKIMSGIFIQRDQPTVDGNYRQLNNIGLTEYGRNFTRPDLESRHTYNIFLNPITSSTQSWQSYGYTNYPSKRTGF